MTTSSSYDYYVNLFLRNKRPFVLMALAVMTIGVILAYTLPKKYEAQSTVFLEQNVITDLVKGIAISPPVESKLKMLSVSLLSRTMILKVLSEMNRDLTLKNDSDVEDYLGDLTKRISISYMERQGVFKITLRDSDPRFASTFVNTLTRKYIDENTSSKREESLDATRFLAEQIETFKRRIDTADEAINRYKSEKGLILATDELFLRGEIANAEKKLEELTIKRNELEAKKRIFQERGPEPGRLAEAEARLAELLGRYTSEHPKVQSAMAEVARLKSGRGESARTRTSGAAIKDSLQMVQVEIDSLKEMEERQKRILDDSKGLLRDIPNVRSALAELVRKKENESVVYQQLVARYGQSEVSKQMELQDKSVTFRVLDPAVTPMTPVFPNKLYVILGSVALGLGMGFGFIYLMDTLKGGIKSPSSLKQLDIPVFAVIPYVPDLMQEMNARRKERVFLGLAAGYFLIIMLFATAEALNLDDRAAQAGAAVKRQIARVLN
jgi:polysaccharide chain length determinant protein (PEP-CTERM system associated)